MLIVTSTGLLTDRVLAWTEAIDGIEATIWASSFGTDSAPWVGHHHRVEPFPTLPPEPVRAVTLPIQFNAMVWVAATRTPSRVRPIRDRYPHHRPWHAWMMAPAARIVGRAGGASAVRRMVARRIRKELCDHSIQDRLRSSGASALLVTNPYSRLERVVAINAQLAGIPTLALIPSWDNLSTKANPVIDFDHWLVWSDEQRRQMRTFEPQVTDDAVSVIGAPQFDVFADDRFDQDREEWCKANGLDPNRPIILYAVGSPNFLDEVPGAQWVANELITGAFPHAQLLVRPHPIHDRNELLGALPQHPDVHLQQFDHADLHVVGRSQDRGAIVDWVNTFRHVDVVINMCSTVAIDAAVAGTPVINLGFDVAPGAPRRDLIRRINNEWTHFAPLPGFRGFWQAKDFDDLRVGIRYVLAHPEMREHERKAMAEFVIGPLDGKSGQRFNRAVKFFLERVSSPPRPDAPR